MRKTISIARYYICNKTDLAFPGQSLKAVSVVRGTFVIHKILSSAIKKHLHDVKLYSFHTAPHAILKNRIYLQNYLYVGNQKSYSADKSIKWCPGQYYIILYYNL